MFNWIETQGKCSILSRQLDSDIIEMLKLQKRYYAEKLQQNRFSFLVNYWSFMNIQSLRKYRTMCARACVRVCSVLTDMNNYTMSLRTCRLNKMIFEPTERVYFY